MTQYLIYYLQGYCYNVKIYAEYFVMFNKLELEQTLWSGVSGNLCPSWFGSPLQAPCPFASPFFSTRGPSPPVLMCLTGFPGFRKVCGKCEILSKAMRACSRCWAVQREQPARDQVLLPRAVAAQPPVCWEPMSSHVLSPKQKCVLKGSVWGILGHRSLLALVCAGFALPLDRRFS